METSHERWVRESALDWFVRTEKLRGMVAADPVVYTPLRDRATLRRTAVSGALVALGAGITLGWIVGSVVIALALGLGVGALFAWSELELRALRKD